MRGAWIIAAAGIVGALIPDARAGVYFTSGTLVREFARPDDPDAQELWPRPSPFKQFRLDLAAYRSAVVKGPVQSHYLERVAALKAKESQGLLSLDDRINLGAYYIRLGQYKDAITVLQEAQHSRHFLLHANLATAYELADPEKQGGDLRLALRSREMALDYWPISYAGWDSGMLYFYRKAEQFHLALLKSRQAEAPPMRGQSHLRLDNLFPRVRFVGPSGKYEAGSIALKPWCELPADAVDQVMQLHLWLPFDDRLSWMLGELFNASGDVGAAAEMMSRVVGTLNQAQSVVPPDLDEHWRIVTEAADKRDKFITNPEVLKDRYWQLKLFCVVVPRGMNLGAGDLIQEASWPAIVIEDENRRASKDAQAPSTASPPSPLSPPVAGEPWMPNWRPLAVGFGAGVAIALLLAMQYRQMGRSKG